MAKLPFKCPYVVHYCVFDVIQLNGIKVSNLPLLSRKELLNKIIPSNHSYIAVVQWIPGNANAYFDLIKQQDLEGIVLKKSDSVYDVGKRSYNWLKVINYQYEVVYITGIRKDEFGVLLSFLDGKPAGIIEFIPTNDRKKLYSLSKVHFENDKFLFIDPIKCRVKYRNLTKQGKLRIPSIVDWL
ncbi:ATP-dependent DNA ligase [Metabacillus sp. Hm71]|uniref:ATP-dependent DNA ligase n=1 Tax=Metabacillus sp. Hm71 TaxID=3450743 RepID=UPI003F4357F2